jgi:hypothetical protein
MSAHAGCFMFGNAPVPQHHVATLERMPSDMGPNAGMQFDLPDLVMVTREDPRRGPVRGRSLGRCGDVVLAWDGDLHNREELRLMLPPHVAAACDAVLVATHLDTRGPAGLRDLVGDWTAAVWSGKSRELILAADYAGIRPLYYWSDERRVVWSSALDPLARAVGASAKLDVAFMRGILTSTPVPGATPYSDIHCVMPGTWLRFASDGRITSERYWRPAARTFSGGTRDYEEGLRHHLLDAVRSRVASHSPTWLELSGGFDSTLLASLASSVLAEAGREPLRTVHFAAAASPESDERRFGTAAARWAGTRHVEIDMERFPFAAATPTASPRTIGDFERKAYELMRADDAITMLCGRAGDLVLGAVPTGLPAIGQAFYTGRLLESLAIARRCGLETKRSLWGLLADAIADGSDERGRRRRSRKFVRKYSRDGRPSARQVFCLTTELAELPEPDDATSLIGGTAHLAPGARALARGVARYCITRTLESPQDLPLGRWTVPFTHRPFVEFVLSIPPLELCAPGAPRSLMLRAFPQAFPPEVARRVSKGHVGPASIREFRTLALAMLANVPALHCVERGFVDAEPLTRALRGITSGSAKALGNLAVVYRLEQWLRRIDIPKSPAGEAIAIGSLLTSAPAVHVAMRLVHAAPSHAAAIAEPNQERR